MSLYEIFDRLTGNFFTPITHKSAKWKNWIAVLDFKTCYVCKTEHGKIYFIKDNPIPKHLYILFVAVKLRLWMPFIPEGQHFLVSMAQIIGLQIIVPYRITIFLFLTYQTLVGSRGNPLQIMLLVK